MPKLQYHIAASTAVSGLMYLIFKSWGLTTASFISGIFIDIDHIYDVIREHGKDTTIQEFFHISHGAQFHKVFLLFHAWEWLFAGLLLSWYSNWNHWVIGAVIGITHHLIMDSIYNSANFLSYSLFWRWKHNFHFDTIFNRLIDHKYSYRK